MHSPYFSVLPYISIHLCTSLFFLSSASACSQGWCAWWLQSLHTLKTCSSVCMCMHTGTDTFLLAWKVVDVSAAGDLPVTQCYLTLWSCRTWQLSSSFTATALVSWWSAVGSLWTYNFKRYQQCVYLSVVLRENQWLKQTLFTCFL